ncbi:MAG: hypothetical protein AUK47_21700 [Deltaproteobacteria bacterium CG2_30_63_29]|nr:MAG: hypothetical protein AUK47_21700 [Deltaproteobacteria bacterium CG2_30_63_29]PIW00046.1 MAG: hypothetical protein COW42_09115 [Deltaproteobacteria bacterium CG17_big_fil_post_rev_8_21_14_2_50_63_7]PJB46587.1 MAG: hypothetical protein CO108_05630 [Deltaproteobacteria bacterium CG_4_9_14_3_um_filter_63_12]
MNVLLKTSVFVVLIAVVGLLPVAGHAGEERWNDFVFGAPEGWELSHYDFPSGVNTRVYALHSADGDWLSLGLIDAKMVAVPLSTHKLAKLEATYFDAFFTARNMLLLASQPRSCAMDVEDWVEVNGSRHSATGPDGEETLYSCIAFDRRNGRMIVILGWSEAEREDTAVFEMMTRFSKTVGFQSE